MMRRHVPMDSSPVIVVYCRVNAYNLFLGKDNTHKIFSLKYYSFSFFIFKKAVYTQQLVS
jgi:hypothetical protein